MADKITAISFFGRRPYCNLFPQIPTLTETDYFLQFNGYEIFLPQSAHEQELLNIFELSVLKFKALGNFSLDELSERLCLQKDFVKFILVRLTELGLLDDSRQITERGRAFLGEKISAQPENIVPYLLPVSRDSGEIFPSFIPRQNQIDGVLEKSFIKIFFGSTGKATSLGGRCVFVREKNPHPQILPQKKIRDALRKFNRMTDAKIFVDAATNIQSTFTEPIFLHVKAVLQDGNVDYAIVSDGQSPHSDFLRDVLERNNPQMLMRLKESATKFSEQLKENFAPAYKKYFEIRRAMLWEETSTANLDERELATDKQRRQVENLSKAIDWALRYHLLKFPPPQQLMRTLAIQTPEENFKTLTGFAAQLGLDEARNFPKFFSGISGNGIRNCLTTENPAIVPLLAVNIATAVRVADSNILSALKVLPEDDAFGFLQRVDAYGKELRHENSWTPQKNDTPTFLRDNVLEFIRALLPDYDDPTVGTADLSNASQQKLNAQMSVIRALGREIFDALSADVQALTLKISPDKSGGQIPAPVEFVTTLSMILEKILLRKLKKFPAEITATKSEIIARLSRAGKSTDLRTVGEIFFNRACRRETATLGAYALAYMATLSDEQFDKFTAKNFHALIYEIATLRGHANNLALIVDAEKLFALRDKIFSAIKFLEADEIGTDKS